MKILPRGPIWRRHLDQLRFRHSSREDAEPGDVPRSVTQQPDTPVVAPQTAEPQLQPEIPMRQLDDVFKEEPQQLRRSGRLRRKPQRYGYEQ